MAELTFEIRGGAELQARLRELPVKIERNVLRAAIRAGAKVFQDEARRRVPVRTGRLRDNIRVSVRLVRGRVLGTVKAGGGKNAVWYAHLVERGTSPHVILPAGGTLAGQALAVAGRILGARVDHPGAAAKPFMRPAFDSRAAAALAAVAERIRVRLARLDSLEA